jgi:glycosyltransferase 2 family protein
MRALTRARELVAALRRRPRLLRTLEVIVGVAVVGLCVWSVRGEWSKAWPELRRARLGYVALALGTVAAYYLVFILGWIRILAAWGMNVSYIAALQSEMVSMLAKYVPGGVWTPAARVAALSRLTGETAIGTILASILVEAMLSAISGVAVFVVSLAWVHEVDVPLAPLVFFALLCFLVVHPRIFGPLMRKLTRPFGLAPIEPLPFSLMGRLLVFYCGTWLIGGLALYFLIRSVGGTPDLATIPFLGGTAAIGAIVAVVAVFTPSGLGVREASMYALLIAITSNSAALGATILNRLVITLVELALFSVGIGMWRLRQRRAARPTPYGVESRPEGSPRR